MRTAPMTRTSRIRIEQLEDRLTPNTAGMLDPSFGTGGVVHTGSVVQVANVRDGRIFALLADPFSGFSPYTLRAFLPDGTLDTTFGSGGVVTVPGTPGSGINTALVPAPDGGVYVAGLSAVMHVTVTGTLDTAF